MLPGSLAQLLGFPLSVQMEKWLGVSVAESGWYYLWQRHSVSVCKLGGNPGLAFSFARGPDGILCHFKSSAISCCVPLSFSF